MVMTLRQQKAMFAKMPSSVKFDPQLKFVKKNFFTKEQIKRFQKQASMEKKEANSVLKGKNKLTTIESEKFVLLKKLVNVKNVDQPSAEKIILTKKQDAVLTKKLTLARVKGVDLRSGARLGFLKFRG